MRFCFWLGRENHVCFSSTNPSRVQVEWGTHWAQAHSIPNWADEERGPEEGSPALVYPSS